MSALRKSDLNIMERSDSFSDLLSFKETGPMSQPSLSQPECSMTLSFSTAGSAVDENGEEQVEDDPGNVDLGPSQRVLSVDEVFDDFEKAYRQVGGKGEVNLRSFASTIVTSDTKEDVRGPSGTKMAPGLLKLALYVSYYEGCLLRHETSSIRSAQCFTLALEHRYELGAAKQTEYRCTLGDEKEGKFDDARLNAWMKAFCPLQDVSRDKEVFDALLELRDGKLRLGWFKNLHSCDDDFRLSAFCCDLIVRFAEYTREKKKAASEKMGQQPRQKKAKVGSIRNNNRPLPTPEPLWVIVGNDVVVRLVLPGVIEQNTCVRRRSADLFIYAGPHRAVVDREITLGKASFDQVVQSLPPVDRSYLEDSLAGERMNKIGLSSHWAIQLPAKVYVRQAPVTQLRNGILTVMVPFVQEHNEDEVF